MTPFQREMELLKEKQKKRANQKKKQKSKSPDGPRRQSPSSVTYQTI
jgi:hypothetical protein